MARVESHQVYNQPTMILKLTDDNYRHNNRWKVFEIVECEISQVWIIKNIQPIVPVRKSILKTGK